MLFHPVLIIEEKNQLRSFYADTLLKTGLYEVDAVATAQEALDILEKKAAKIKLIILNWNMTDMPGFVFCQKIRGQSRFSHIEFLVWLLEVDTEDSFLLSELDITHTLSKITSSQEYLQTVNDIRAEYKRLEGIIFQLKTLQALINEFQEERCEELFLIPQIQQEIHSNPKYIHLAGELLILRKQYQEACQFLKDFLLKNKDKPAAENVKSLSTLGRALCLSGHFEDALQIFEKLEAKSPKNLSHKVMAGDALMGLEELIEAEALYGDVLEADPENNQALMGLGKVHALKGDYKTSKSFFESVTGNFESRTLASFFNNRGVAMVRQGQIAEAVTFYENALQFLERFRGLVYFNLGLARYRQGQIVEAVEAFQAALNTPDAAQLASKALIKELQAKGPERFIADWKQLNRE